MKKLFKAFWKLVVWCWNNPVMKYIFFGGCATLVNLGTYFLLRTFTPMNLNLANWLSIMTAIVFAYITNSTWVFESKVHGFGPKMIEFGKFFGARASTMVIEIGGVWLFADVLHMNDFLGKFLVQFVVLVLNYVFSKLFVFKKKPSDNEASDIEVSDTEVSDAEAANTEEIEE